MFMNPNTDENRGVATLEPPRPAAKLAPAPEPVHSDWGDDEQELTGFKKWRTPLLVGVIAITGITFAVKALSKSDGSRVKRQDMAIVSIQALPPPPPPPPPPPETMKEEKMIEQEEEKEAEPDPEPAVTTAVQGPSSGGMAVAASNRGSVIKPSGQSGKTKWGWYASQVQGRVSEALRGNARTRAASGRVEVRIWADTTGRITRAKLTGTTGDAAVDRAIENDVLTGLRLNEPPPDGMPMPIVMRVTARRPN